MQAAYADHLHKPINCSDDLPQTCRPEYAKQREYFYDAEGMRRNLRDVIENGEQEFDALKVDLYDGICDICASDYADASNAISSSRLPIVWLGYSPIPIND